MNTKTKVCIQRHDFNAMWAERIRQASWALIGIATIYIGGQIWLR